MQNIKEFDERLMQLGYPRIDLFEGPSPIRFLRNISAKTGCKMYIKRDDIGELGMGGNKLRKLEFLLAHARSQGANRIITIGAMQSNHARLTACVAKMLGFQVDLVLKASVPEESSAYLENGNLLLDRLLDVKIHRLTKNEDGSAYSRYLSEDYGRKGERVYFIPIGGSTMVGSLGYMRAAYEIQRQNEAFKLPIQQIGLATGSGGTHAGLMAGFALLGKPATINAYNVQPQNEPLERHTAALLAELCALLEMPIEKSFVNPRVVAGHAGDQYGIPTDSCLEAVKLLAQTEGVFLDPVYTGKAFSGLLADLREGRLDSSSPVLFIHTGGIPGLFAYPNWF